MINFIVGVSVVSAVYLIISATLVLRRKSDYILRRTLIMLQFCLLGNLVQNIVFLSQIEQIEKHIGIVTMECHIFFRIRQSFNMIGHYLLFFPYILRSYRLLIIFKIDKNWEHTESSYYNYIHRTKQKWMVIFLVVFLMPVLIMCIAILNNCNFANYMPGSEDKHHTNVSEGLFIGISFIEQLCFLATIYNLREISDDYSIKNELTVAMVFWFITPSLIVFPPVDLKRYKNLPGLIRNFLLFLVSFCYPIYCSFTHKNQEEAMTIEMIESIESVVQSKAALEYFDKYIKEIDSKPNESKINISGGELLELYMKCEMFLNCPGEYDKDQIIKELLDSEVVTINYMKDSKEDFDSQVARAKNSIMEILRNEFFGGFKKSKWFSELKRYVNCQEIYTGRLMNIGLSKTYSSLVRNSI